MTSLDTSDFLTFVSFLRPISRTHFSSIKAPTQERSRPKLLISRVLFRDHGALFTVSRPHKFLLTTPNRDFYFSSRSGHFFNIPTLRSGRFFDLSAHFLLVKINIFRALSSSPSKKNLKKPSQLPLPPTLYKPSVTIYIYIYFFIKGYRAV